MQKYDMSMRFVYVNVTYDRTVFFPIQDYAQIINELSHTDSLYLMLLGWLYTCRFHYTIVIVTVIYDLPFLDLCFVYSVLSCHLEF